MKTKLFIPLALIVSLASCSKNSEDAVTHPVKAVTPPVSLANSKASSAIAFSSHNFNIAYNPVDGSAYSFTKTLYSYLRSEFGKKTISGQTDSDNDFNHIKQVTGHTPAIRDYDMQPYSPEYSYNWANGGYAFGPINSPNVSNAISWYYNTNKKAIIDFQWHWHSPSGGQVGTNTFYTQYTSFDVSRAVISGTSEYNAAIRDIDAIAVQLKKLSDGGVPILWRPLHESGGTWFWWSAKGSGPYKALWNIMYNRLVNYHGLHNLIWMWNGNDANWYPGNKTVDILSIDSYPGNFVYTTVQSEFEKVYSISGGQKIIAMSENGPIPDVQGALNAGAGWSFFMSWYDINVGNSDQHLKDVYQNSNVITLESR